MTNPHLIMRLGKWASKASGRPTAFLLAVAAVLVWVCTGPMFKYSDTWQLVINTGTTIVTFLMVFLIQGSQNRDTEAIQLKLDELIRATHGANNKLVDLEELEDHELEAVHESYSALAKEVRDCGDEHIERGTPEVNDALAKLKDAKESLEEAVENVEKDAEKDGKGNAVAG